MFAGRKFLAIAADYAPDVIFAHHGQLAGFVAARVARRLEIPFFITEHDFDEIDDCAHNARRRDFYLEVTQGIGAWIAVADRMRASMNRIFPGVPTVTIHNGAEPVPGEMAAVPRPPAFVSRVVVLCVTFMYKRKNVPLLLQAFDSIADRYPDALLAIGGDGDDMPAVRSALDKARNPSQVLLLGALKHREVMQYMAWCDVFALIGGDEPFATVFSEAMSAGKPIVFASDGGITDVAKNGVHGLAVEPGDAPVRSLRARPAAGRCRVAREAGPQCRRIGGWSHLGAKRAQRLGTVPIGALSRFARPPGRAAFTSRREPATRPK